jgi:hypothetical protein
LGVHSLTIPFRLLSELERHKHIEPGRKRWFDIRGYSVDVMNLIGWVYDLPGGVMKDAGTKQPNKVQVHST